LVQKAGVWQLMIKLIYDKIDDAVARFLSLIRYRSLLAIAND